MPFQGNRIIRTPCICYLMITVFSVELLKYHRFIVNPPCARGVFIIRIPRVIRLNSQNIFNSNYAFRFHPAKLRYIPDLLNFSVEMKHSLDIRHCQEIIRKPF